MGGAGGGSGGSGGSIDPSGGSGGGTAGGDAGGATGSDGGGRAEASGPAATPVEVGPTAAPPRAFQFPGIVTYWGQNGASRVTTDVTKHEKSLAETCQDNPQYEAVIVAFVTEFFSLENIDRTPRTNFSKHCTSMNAYDADHKRLYKCDVIARGINECQRLNKKVLISLGGANGNYGFANDGEARMFAQTTWDLFLGGQHNFRPFTTAILDGIDLDIEGGGSAGYTAYVRRLRELMGGDKSRPWYISAAPQCPTPDAHLGPGAGKVLGDAPGLFDFLNVQFYNNWCGGHNPGLLVQQFDAWAKVGPKILVGLPAHSASGTPFVPRGQLPGILNQVKAKPAFGGVMLWDAGADMHSIENGQTYSGFVKTLLP
jgi:chitinase